PYWRTLKAGGELNPKYPGGLARIRELLEREGHRVVARGERWFVADYELRLVGARRRRPRPRRAAPPSNAAGTGRRAPSARATGSGSASARPPCPPRRGRAPATRPRRAAPRRAAGRATR